MNRHGPQLRRQTLILWVSTVGVGALLLLIIIGPSLGHRLWHNLAVGCKVSIPNSIKNNKGVKELSPGRQVVNCEDYGQELGPGGDSIYGMKIANVTSRDLQQTGCFSLLKDRLMLHKDTQNYNYGYDGELIHETFPKATDLIYYEVATTASDPWTYKPPAGCDFGGKLMTAALGQENGVSYFYLAYAFVNMPAQ